MENTQPTPVSQGNSIWKNIKVAFATILGILVLILIFKNWTSIPLNLLYRPFEAPLPLIIIGCLITGYLWGTVTASRKISRKNTEIRHLQRKVIDLNDKVVSNK